MWDALKCTITGVCIEYCSRKKKERNAKKTNLLKDIEKINLLIDKNPSSEVLSQLDQLQLELNKIIDFETKGNIIRSRSRWMEEGEKSSKYFCNLENRTCEKKTINRLKNENGEVTSNQSEVMKEMH